MRNMHKKLNPHSAGKGKPMGTFLAIIFGTVVSLGIAIFIEYLRRPDLTLEIDPPVDSTFASVMPATKMRSLRVKFSNKRLPGWARWMLRAPAQQCRATITFHNSDSKQDIFDRAMEGRWASSPEPMQLQLLTPEGRPLPDAPPTFMMPESRGIVVYPGDSEILDIAARVDDDDNCYGWNNESYLCTPTWRNPKWQLPRGTYLVKVVVTSSGQKCVRWFSLLNQASPHTAFRLELPPA
jgi:hypothetical protein